MAEALGVSQDASEDEIIDAIDDILDTYDTVDIEPVYTERGLCWVYKGELK